MRADKLKYYMEFGGRGGDGRYFQLSTYTPI